MKNNGVELSLNAQIIDKKDWKWSVSGNIGFNKSEIASWDFCHLTLVSWVRK